MAGRFRISPRSGDSVVTVVCMERNETGLLEMNAEQSQRFIKALAERLGQDPSQLTELQTTMRSSSDEVEVIWAGGSGTLPEQEFFDLAIAAKAG